MPRIAIVTDTDSSLPADLAARYGIRQVPIVVNFGNECYDAAVELDDAGAFARIDREGRIPTTSAPSPGRFADAFRDAFAAGADQVVCFCVSGEVSATYGAAMAGRDLLPDRDITVIDSRTLTMAQGFMVLEAARAAAAGCSVDDVVARAQDVGSRTHVYAALSTLKYLAMSGRVGHLAAGVAGLLNVKPILTVRDGKLDMLEKVRTRSNAWARVVELTRQVCGSVERMAIIHICAGDGVRRFEDALRAGMPCPREIMVAEMNPGMSVHGGAGMVGVVTVAGR